MWLSASAAVTGPPTATPPAEFSATDSAHDPDENVGAVFVSVVSMMVTAAVAGLPALTAAGSVPNDTVTTSSSSSRSSAVALSLNLAEVAWGANTTDARVAE